MPIRLPETQAIVATATLASAENDLLSAPTRPTVVTKATRLAGLE
jgi:hypothetical protein